MPPRPEGVPRRAIGSRQGGLYTIWVAGAEPTVLRDAYHSFLRIRWSASLGLIALAFMLVNLIFAVVYYYVGGVAGLQDDSFFESLVFSVQTIGTIGYGVMHPESHAANVVMIVESIVGIIFTAVVTGLVFAKFSRPASRIQFSSSCVVCQHDGMPTLIFRVGNRRSNTIVETEIHVVAGFTRVTKEGKQFYQQLDLPLVRSRIAAMRRGWAVMHVIDDKSPFHGLTSEDLKRLEVEITISLLGFDDVTLQTAYAMHQYFDHQIVYGRVFADTLTTLTNGDLLLDMTKFDQTAPEQEPRDAT